MKKQRAKQPLTTHSELMNRFAIKPTPDLIAIRNNTNKSNTVNQQAPDTAETDACNNCIWWEKYEDWEGIMLYAEDSGRCKYLPEVKQKKLSDWCKHHSR